VPINTRNGPTESPPQPDRHDDSTASTAPDVVVMLRQDATTGPLRPSMARRKPQRKAPPVFVSLYEPIGRRRWWWYAYRCRTCGAYLLGRAASLDQVTGPRRARCGHQVTVNIARVYTQPGAAS
jgi:hypothetical protein